MALSHSANAPGGAPPSVTWRWPSWAAVALLALLFAQTLAAATSLSATVDEGFHITSGYEYLRTGHMRLLDEHVPLAKALLAWPLFFVPDLLPPEEAAGYAAGDLISVTQETVLAYRPLDRVIVSCRIPVALLAVLLAATVYRCAADLAGHVAGLLALFLLAFDPNLLAHSSLATTDLGATAFIFWAVWAFARYLRHPRAGRWWSAAVLLGLAQGTKLTALLLIPLLGALTLTDAWLTASSARARALLRRALSYAAMVAVAGLVVWALYGFELRPVAGLAGGLPLPAASHIERWLRLQENIAYGREAFLLGQNRMHGWALYFPVAFLVKTPLPTLLLLVVSCWFQVSGFRFRMAAGNLRPVTCNLRPPIRTWTPLLLFPLLYALSALFSSVNIGYRHLLPVLPFLFVLVSRMTYGVWRVPSYPRTTHHVSRFAFYASRLALSVLLVWLVVGTVGVAPHYLAYFNELAGGPDNGYRFLADSNTDWGQGLRALARYQQEHHLGPVRLSVFTFLDPAAYGVVYEPIAPMRGAAPVLPRRFNPAPGLYAISATTLDGVPLPLPSTFDWFRHREPLARVAHAIFIYEVTADEDGTWVAQCTTPTVPLTTEALTEGFGSTTLRQVTFDCAQAWLFPADGAGWYVRATPGVDRLRWPSDSQHLEWWPTWVQRMSLDGLRLGYVQPMATELPAFAIWRWPGGAVTPPERVDEGEVSLEGVLTFLGYQAPSTARAGISVEVLTYWRVLRPPARPLSLMLHLSASDGVPLAVGDGLGVPIEGWRPGDVIVQRHTLAIPADTPPGAYTLRSGAYWLDDMTRLTAGDRSDITLRSLTVP